MLDTTAFVVKNWETALIVPSNADAAFVMLKETGVNLLSKTILEFIADNVVPVVAILKRPNTTFARENIALKLMDVVRNLAKADACVVIALKENDWAMLLDSDCAALGRLNVNRMLRKEFLENI